jgi:hypothetical protein
MSRMRVLSVVRSVVVAGIALAGSTLMTSCATVPQNGSARMAPTDGANWTDVLRENTRRVETWSSTLRTADLRATLVTPRLRAAFIQSRAQFHGQFARERFMDLVALGEKDQGVDAPMTTHPGAEEQVIVFVSMYVQNQKNREVAIHSSIWDTHLVRGKASVAPTHIDVVKISPAVVDMFPYVDRFDDVYVFRFPIVDAATGTSFTAPGDEPLRLEVQSALADARVSWTLVQ